MGSTTASRIDALTGDARSSMRRRLRNCNRLETSGNGRRDRLLQTRLQTHLWTDVETEYGAEAPVRASVPSPHFHFPAH